MERLKLGILSGVGKVHEGQALRAGEGTRSVHEDTLCGQDTGGVQGGEGQGGGS